MSADSVRFELTGNPFVDTGMAVVASLAGLDSPDGLTLVDVRRVHGVGQQIADYNAELKSFTQIFGTNGPLFQGKKKGERPSARNRAIYRETLNALLDAVSTGTGLPERCQACGQWTRLDFGRCRELALAKAATAEAGGQTPEPPARSDTRALGQGEECSPGRDWFPLVGSLGSDAQGLPGASRPLRLCARCLFAVHYLPLAVIAMTSRVSMKGRLVLFQSAARQFWYDIVRTQVEDSQARVKKGLYDTPGSGEGARAIIHRLMAVGRSLASAQRLGEVPVGTGLQVWLFSNSGSSPDCEVLDIPHPALRFLLDAAANGLEPEVNGLLKTSQTANKFFDAVVEGRDFSGLYPDKTGAAGASRRLFELYQTRICDRSDHALRVASFLAAQARQRLGSDLGSLKRREALWEAAGRQQFRRLIARLAGEGKLTIADYYALFPIEEDSPGVRVRRDGWNLLRYYLHGNEDAGQPVADQQALSPKQAMIRFYASTILNDYNLNHGRERFEREVLGSLERNILGLGWLKNRFLRLARAHPGFTYAAFGALVHDQGARPRFHEALYEMRVCWIEALAGGEPSSAVMPTLPEGSGLPSRVEACIRYAIGRLVERKGRDSLGDYVIERLRRRDLGPGWFRRVLVNDRAHNALGGMALTAREWDGLLLDDQGRPWEAERLFQLQLALVNLLRVLDANVVEVS